MSLVVVKEKNAENSKILSILSAEEEYGDQSLQLHKQCVVLLCYEVRHAPISILHVRVLPVVLVVYVEVKL